jgi:hypothetical protein
MSSEQMSSEQKSSEPMCFEQMCLEQMCFEHFFEQMCFEHFFEQMCFEHFFRTNVFRTFFSNKCVSNKCFPFGSHSHVLGCNASFRHLSLLPKRAFIRKGKNTLLIDSLPDKLG